jgi:cyclin-dependent kinase 12/13
MWPHQDAILLSTWFVNVTFDINLHLFAELQRWRFVTQANAKSKSKKFPPPHQDGAVGYPLDASRKGPVSFGAPDTSFGSSVFNSKSSGTVKSIGASGGPSRRKTIKEDLHAASSRKFIRAFKPSSIGLSMDLIFKGK